MANSEITKVSDITVTDVTDYLRIPEITAEDTALLTTALNVAKQFVMSYTGLDAEGMDAHEDLVIVIYVLCQSMYDNRAYYVDKSNLNNVVESILNLHSINLLPLE
ncbi:head-tail connector protein [uncultured Methanobrevibacter sp.]|uniref:head-tail connector protein n=1 Tax=uncultured Methanobrevibacter sp. TaxID=253161 RepID=UPI00262ACC7D|nr:head-tail connector protein [uncultured Methanobrevibacter sp.]